LAFFHQVIDIWDLRTITFGRALPVPVVAAIATTLVATALIAAAPSPGAAIIACHTGSSLSSNSPAFP
jgi:hypothetical protein